MPQDYATINQISEKARYLGPARIIAVEGRRVQLECPDEFPWARLALADSYAAVEGDIVLAIGGGADWYVIGLLEGHGTTVFTAPGNVELHAPHGKIRLLAGQGIDLQSERIGLVADKVEVTARTLLEKFAEVTRWISGALHLRAGRVHAQVDGDSYLKAGRITEQAEGEVKVQGKMIHLN